ncbi:MAG: putative phosphoribosyl transferase [Actinomycetota bacterium]|jgi:predicted phosphoribosyltransferase|nr:putative phosphoribosyl transferase [Actinomycetota bacterium]
MGVRTRESRYRDRRHAGQVLGWRLVEAGVLDRFRGPRLVLGLPRGGVPVAAEVARILAAPLDVFLVRKLGVPGHEELAMGAIAGGGTRVLNRVVIERLGVSDDDVEAVARAEADVLARRERVYRHDRPPSPVTGATVIVVDDGLATGASMRAALQGLRAQEPTAVVAAVPVGSADTCRALRADADDVLCVRMPDRFLAVGQAYDDFSPTTDDEVRAVLDALWCGTSSAN